LFGRRHRLQDGRIFGPLDGKANVEKHFLVARAAKANHLRRDFDGKITLHFPHEMRVLAGAREFFDATASVVGLETTQVLILRDTSTNSFGSVRRDTAERNLLPQSRFASNQVHGKR
jgi:hypothetical protein